MRRLTALAFALLIAIGSAADARTRHHAATPAPAAATQPQATAEQRIEDLNWLVDTLKAKYAYRDKKNIDLDQIKTLYRDAAEKATTPAAWLALVERVVAELYDHHATLAGTMTTRRN